MVKCEYPGLAEGLRIHRDVDADQWRAAIQELPDELQPGAEQYLSGIVERHRNLVRFAREADCKSLDEFDDLRRQARRAGAPGGRAWVRAGRPEKWRGGSGY